MNHRYRKKDEPENSECSLCSKPIWVREGVYTVYHGKPHMSITDEIQSFATLDNGSVCVECFKKQPLESK